MKKLVLFFLFLIGSQAFAYNYYHSHNGFKKTLSETVGIFEDSDALSALNTLSPEEKAEIDALVLRAVAALDQVEVDKLKKFQASDNYKNFTDVRKFVESLEQFSMANLARSSNFVENWPYASFDTQTIEKENKAIRAGCIVGTGLGVLIAAPSSSLKAKAFGLSLVKYGSDQLIPKPNDYYDEDYGYYYP